MAKRLLEAEKGENLGPGRLGLFVVSYLYICIYIYIYVPAVDLQMLYHRNRSAHSYMLGASTGFLGCRHMYKLRGLLDSRDRGFIMSQHLKDGVTSIRSGLSTDLKLGDHRSGGGWAANA